MLNKKYFQFIRQNLLSYAEKRREVIKAAGDAQHRAKRAIFALQRDNRAEAEANLKIAAGILTSLYKKYQKDNRIFDEGSFKAGLEEYIEAELFNQFLLKREIGEIKGFKVNPDTYIAGLCDLPGEIMRYAIAAATKRQTALVQTCYAAVQAIIGELVDMNLTGYNRQKFDQAKAALDKLQHLTYEVTVARGANS